MRLFFHDFTEKKINLLLRSRFSRFHVIFSLYSPPFLAQSARSCIFIKVWIETSSEAVSFPNNQATVSPLILLWRREKPIVTWQLRVKYANLCTAKSEIKDAIAIPTREWSARFWEESQSKRLTEMWAFRAQCCDLMMMMMMKLVLSYPRALMSWHNTVS